MEPIQDDRLTDEEARELLRRALDDPLLAKVLTIVGNDMVDRSQVATFKEREPIQDDIETVRSYIDWDDRASTPAWNKAHKALDRLIAERDAEVNKRVILETRKMEEAWLAERDRLQGKAEEDWAALGMVRAERDRLIQALERIADLHPAEHAHPAIAREALTKTGQ